MQKIWGKLVLYCDEMAQALCDGVGRLTPIEPIIEVSGLQTIINTVIYWENLSFRFEPCVRDSQLARYFFNVLQLFLILFIYLIRSSMTRKQARKWLPLAVICIILLVCPDHYTPRKRAHTDCIDY